MKVMPPLKREWKQGNTQLGLFIRFPDGKVIEMTQNNAHDEVAAKATELLRAMCSGPVKP